MISILREVFGCDDGSIFIVIAYRQPHPRSRTSDADDFHRELVPFEGSG